MGQKKPNAWGLYDMSGNVCEWCGDWHNNYPADKEAVDPKGPARGSLRVMRGGSWNYDPYFWRSAHRSGNSASDRENHVGFRLVRTIE